MSINVTGPFHAKPPGHDPFIKPEEIGRAMMNTGIKSEHLDRNKNLVNCIADPNVRLAIVFAAMEYGTERYVAGSEAACAIWQDSINPLMAVGQPE